MKKLLLMITIIIGIMSVGCEKKNTEIKEETSGIEETTTITQEMETIAEKTATVVETKKIESPALTNQKKNKLCEEKYKKILDQYYKALSESWDVFELEKKGICYLCSQYDDMSEIGYAFIDIDNNGIEELFIGVTEQSDNYGGKLFDMYTIVDDKIVQVAMSGEKDGYSLCTNNRIEYTASYDAYSGVTIGYEFIGDKELKLIEAVIYDRNTDEENPWFYSTSGLTEECYTPITKKEADEMFDRYEPMEISFMPFTEY